jgi:hypothetical protein
MRSHIAIATLMGTTISALLAAFNMSMANTPFAYLQLPGYITIVMLWSPHGGAVPEFVSEAILVGINAVFYGLIIFGILHRFGQRRLISQIPKDD